MVNVLVLPIIPYAMLTGFLSILPLVGVGFAFLTSIMLAYVLAIISWFARLPLSSTQVAINGWVAALLYGVLVLTYLLLRWMAFGRYKAFVSESGRQINTTLLRL